MNRAFRWVFFSYQQTFALKFKDADAAKEFSAAFASAQAENATLLAGLDAKEGATEASELAAELSGTSIKGGADEATEATPETEKA